MRTRKDITYPPGPVSDVFELLDADFHIEVELEEPDPFEVLLGQVQTLDKVQLLRLQCRIDQALTTCGDVEGFSDSVSDTVPPPALTAHRVF